MPCKESFGFSVSFHPLPQEFDKYKSQFLDRISKKFNNDKYVMSLEKGKNSSITHIQGFIEFDKEKRSDTFKKSFNKAICKGMEFVNPKCALVLKPYNQGDLIRGVGYTLKEQNIELDDVACYSYDIDYLLQCREHYLSSKIDKKCSLDKIRVNVRCLPEVFDNYCLQNKDYFVGKLYDEIPEESVFTPIQVARIIGLMGQNNYYVLPIVLNKDFNKICEYISAKSSGKLMNFTVELFLKGRKAKA